MWRIACDSRWAGESLFDWVEIEYPDFEAYRQKVAELEKLDWYRYWGVAGPGTSVQLGPALDEDRLMQSPALALVMR